MQSSRPSPHAMRTGILLAAGAAILYGAAYPATGIALHSFTPLGIAGIACTMALAVVVILALIGVLPRPAITTLDRASLLRLVALTGFGGIGFIAAVNVAVGLSGPTVTGFVAPLYAVFATLFAVPLLGERIRPVTLVSFALALVGTALLAGVEPSASGLSGVALAAGSAALFGTYIVLARRWGVRYGLDGTTVTIANLISRGPLLLLVEWLRAPATIIPANPEPAAIIALLTIAFGSSSTANLLLIGSTRLVPAGRTSAALLLTPISSAVLGAIVLSERLAPLQGLGAVLILAGIAGASGVVDLIVGRRRREGLERDEAVPQRDPG
jgi:probable blue pigment (indigoidine) exporter